MERAGIGFDSHKYKEGNGLVLGGVVIPCQYSFDAHSDGDIIIHSIIDSILGALPDVFDYQNIGSIFPDNDPTFKNISSVKLLEYVLEKIKPWRIYSCDVVIIMEEPKLKTKVRDIIENLKILLKTELVNVKPKTAEGMGIIGEKKGAAATCITILKQ